MEIETRRAPVAVGLVHYPVRDRAGTVVASNITNFDIHDIARASRSYGVDRYYIIHPHQEQLMFVSRILEHWRLGEGSRYNPMRRTALNHVRPVESISEAVKDWGEDTLLVGTTARDIPGVERISFRSLREQIESRPERRILLLFGTGFGLTTEVLSEMGALLEPIKGAPPQDYRHLSVRSAVTICLDRLLGAW
jgi:hypothetical protein